MQNTPPKSGRAAFVRARRAAAAAANPRELRANAAESRIAAESQITAATTGAVKSRELLAASLKSRIADATSAATALTVAELIANAGGATTERASNYMETLTERKNLLDEKINDILALINSTTDVARAEQLQEEYAKIICDRVMIDVEIQANEAKSLQNRGPQITAVAAATYGPLTYMETLTERKNTLQEKINATLVGIISVTDVVRIEQLQEEYAELVASMDMLEVEIQEEDAKLLKELATRELRALLVFYEEQHPTHVGSLFDAIPNGEELQTYATKNRFRIPTTLDHKRELAGILNAMRKQLKIVDYEGTTVDIIGGIADPDPYMIRCKGLVRVACTMEIVKY